MGEQPMMDRLRAETKGQHERIERLPYFGALRSGQLERKHYLAHLKAFSIMLGVLERELTVCTHPSVQKLWSQVTPKLPWLQEDITYLQEDVRMGASNVVRKALDVTEEFRRCWQQNPIRLLGVLYVFEGSTLGASHLRAEFCEQLSLPDEGKGTRYFLSYEERVADQWVIFRELMNQTITDPEDQQSVVEMAQQTFGHLEEVFTLCFPLKEEDSQWELTDINPEAGVHAIPDDPREVLAAIEAGERCLREIPYFSWRYGERGVRFTRSDSAWLVTLGELEEVSMFKQIDWLCRVLGARGMPRYMMEVHLGHLYAALSEAIPEKRTTYGKFEKASQRLANVRRGYLAEDDFVAIAQEVDNRLEAIEGERSRGLGKVLVSAIIDEQDGVPRALSSALSWFMDKEKFTDEWCELVEVEVKRIRKLAQVGTIHPKLRDEL